MYRLQLTGWLDLVLRARNVMQKRYGACVMCVCMHAYVRVLCVSAAAAITLGEEITRHLTIHFAAQFGPRSSSSDSDGDAQKYGILRGGSNHNLWWPLQWGRRVPTPYTTGLD